MRGRHQDRRPAAPEPETSRRQALAKLGLAVAAAYVAPLVLDLNRAAAKSGPGSQGDSPASAPSAPSAASAPSAPSAASAPSN